MKKNAIFSLVFFIFPTAHSEEKYDLSFLEGVGGVSIKDAAEFDKGNDVLPGEYSLTVYLNDKELPAQQITYKKISADKISAVFSCNTLKQCLVSGICNLLPILLIAMATVLKTVSRSMPQYRWVKRKNITSTIASRMGQQQTAAFRSRGVYWMTTA